MAKERILIIEDERAVARGVEYGLKAEGFTVLWAENGDQGHPAGPGAVTAPDSAGHPPAEYQRL